jgi:hypothetical protein
MKKLLLFLNLCFITSVYSLSAEQLDIKPIMPQQQLLAQKDALERLVNNVWNQCLNTLNGTFPYVAQPDQRDQHVINVNGSFEKQPKTDDSVLLIKKSVHDAIAATSMSLIKFGKTEQEQVFKEMLERMVASTLVELILKDADKFLDWCTCTAEYKRITLALLMVNEILEKFPNKNERIVYTTFASGDLLQDYVVLNELLLSHINIVVNLIDLDNPDIFALAKKNLRKEEPHSLHMLEMKNQQERADVIDAFKVKMAQIISGKKSNGERYHFDVNLYQNAYEYIYRVKANPQEKSNILLMVDPGAGIGGVADFPSLSNVINVWIDQEIVPVFTIYLPRHHGAHLYQLKETVNPKTVQYLHNQLLQLMVSTGVTKQYTPNLTNALLSKTISFDKKITDEVLASSFPQLMQTRVDLREQALQQGFTEEDLLQPLTPIRLGNVSVLLSWGTDAHINFQDLVWDALAPNAIVYQLYAINPNESDDANNKIIKVNPELYKKVDVVIPNTGRMSEESQYEDQYKRIH